VTEERDWRLHGQEAFLARATLVRKAYRARSATWENDHCEFCSAKPMDPGFSGASEAHRGAPNVLTEGYTTTDEHPNGPDYHWIRPDCFDDFADRFGWRVVPG
jgi:hypothetical protein